MRWTKFRIDCKSLLFYWWVMGNIRVPARTPSTRKNPYRNKIQIASYFLLTGRVPSDHPCIVLGPVVPLDKREPSRAELAERVWIRALQRWWPTGRGSTRGMSRRNTHCSFCSDWNKNVRSIFKTCLYPKPQLIFRQNKFTFKSTLSKIFALAFV